MFKKKLFFCEFLIRYEWIYLIKLNKDTSMKNNIEGIQGNTLQLAKAEESSHLVYSNICSKQAFAVMHDIHTSALRDACESWEVKI